MLRLGKFKPEASTITFQTRNSSRNHKPQTTNHKPQNHKPQTTNHNPQTTNHKPQTATHKPQTSNHNLSSCSGTDVGPYGAALVFNQTDENASPFKFANRDVVVNGRTVSFQVSLRVRLHRQILLSPHPAIQGYFVDVPLEEEKANAILANLINNNWIDGQTRRLLVTLEAWNLQLDQVVVMFWEV